MKTISKTQLGVAGLMALFTLGTAQAAVQVEASFICGATNWKAPHDSKAMMVKTISELNNEGYEYYEAVLESQNLGNPSETIALYPVKTDNGAFTGKSESGESYRIVSQSKGKLTFTTGAKAATAQCSLARK